MLKIIRLLALPIVILLLAMILIITIGYKGIGVMGKSPKNGKPETKQIYATENKMEKVVKSDKQWQEELTGEQYRVARKKGTERPFTGKYNEHKGDGIYRCVCCGNELFDSGTKFNSGSGWPSFYAPVSSQKVRLEEDNSLFMNRTEVLCSKCDAHLGHVFNDGPAPTHQRYCINSVSLKFANRNNSDLKER